MCLLVGAVAFAHRGLGATHLVRFSESAILGQLGDQVVARQWRDGAAAMRVVSSIGPLLQALRHRAAFELFVALIGIPTFSSPHQTEHGMNQANTAAVPYFYRPHASLKNRTQF